MILVTAKVNPDLDGVACTLAYADLLNKTGREAQGLISGDPQSEVQYFVENHGLITPSGYLKNWDQFVLVDASSMKGMPNVVVADKVVEIIDHRESTPEKEFHYAKVQNELIGAAATLVVERFRQVNLKPESDHAKFLYGAIYHNTLNFIATNATERDKKAANFLAENFGLSENLISDMFAFVTKQIRKDVVGAIQKDAKEFGKGYKQRAYQLIGYDLNLGSKWRQIEIAVANLDKSLGVEWSLLNIVDLKTKTSTIYVSKMDKLALMEKALGYRFANQWTTLPAALLRKQIVPKIQVASL